MLVVDDLSVDFAGPAGPVPAVRGVSFAMGRERLALVGESGSGKSVTARAVLGLLPAAARVTAHRLTFAGADLLAMSTERRRALLGRRLGLVMQDPRHSLNPVMTIGRQILESCRVAGLTGRAAAERARALLAEVGLADAERILRAYPHELSGGMGQRAMIAMVLAAGPELLVADEPTSALDATVEGQVLALLDRLVRERGMGLLLIAHDLDLVAGFCDRVLVMRNGRVVDEAPAGALHESRHPYTRALLAARPRLGEAPP